MVEVVTLRSLMVQWKLSPFLWLWNPLRIPTNISTWTESCQNSYLPWRVVTCFVFSCDEMWILVLSDELRLHMVHNYILIYVRNWLWILGKWKVVIFNIASIRLPDKGLTMTYRFGHTMYNLYNFFTCVSHVPHTFLYVFLHTWG